MAKKVDDWIIAVIVILAALLIANLFVSGTILASLSTISNSIDIDLGPPGGLSGERGTDTIGSDGGGDDFPSNPTCRCPVRQMPEATSGVYEYSYEWNGCGDDEDEDIFEGEETCLACVAESCGVAYVYSGDPPPVETHDFPCIWDTYADSPKGQ
jgi:hypothetical protein